MSSGASFTSWGEGAFLALVGHPSSDAVTIKMPYGVVLHWPALHLFFLIGLVKTESGFIVRSAELGLGRWALVVPVISVDAYLFLFFPYLTCHLEDIVMGVLWFHCATVPMCRYCFTDGKETDFRSSDQEASPSAGKNTGVVLVLCLPIEVFPYSYFWCCA